MPLEKDGADLFMKLLSKTKIAVISGGGYPRMQVQLLQSLPISSESFSNLYILPTSGTRFYTWRGTWNEVYAEHLIPTEKERITSALNDSLRECGYVTPTPVYGDTIEDRGSQITFSGLGQNAPIEAKAVWDKDRKTREKIAETLRLKIPEFDIRLAGTTSIDITKRGINKAFGIRKLEEYLKIGPDKILFVGDALFQGGNDFPAKATGVDCIQVNGPEETKKLIEGWIS
jgi:HAD superfamily hydrolase (TIGR01484 family)